MEKSDESNVFVVPFNKEDRQAIVLFLKQNGFKKTEKELLSKDYKPTVVKALLKNIMRNNGW